MNSNQGASEDRSTTTTRLPHTPVLLCWGCGEFGQHGQGHKADVSFRESEVKDFGSAAALGTVTLVSCGASNTVAVTDSGNIYAWGNGNSGQLGSGDRQTRWSPNPVCLSPPLPEACKVRTLACGSRHTMVVLDNGHVYAFGNNFYAQLGYNFREKNYKENQMVPQFLEFLKHRPVREVACGDKHSLFLFHDGSLSAVGNNAHGQIGDGSREESLVPKPVELEEKVKRIACGPNHNLAITETGDVYVWGYGKACGKRRRDVTTPELISFKAREVIQVAGGSTHSLALTAGGRVFSWGFGMDGQLGLGSVVMATRPRRLRHSFLGEGASFVACGDAFSAVITASGRLYMWGRNSHTIEEGQGSLHKVWEPHCVNPEPLRPVRNLACGAWHVAAVTGVPDLMPVSETERGCSDEDTGSEGSVYSRLSSASSVQSAGQAPNTNGQPQDRAGGGVEVSAPPHSTSSPTPRGPTLAKLPPFLIARGKTKLTIGEFYATSSDTASNSDKVFQPSARSSRSSPKNPPSPTPNPSKPQPTTTPPSPALPKVTPLVVEVPSVAEDPESDQEEPLPVSTKEEMGMEGPGKVSQEPGEGNALPPLFLLRKSASSAGSPGEEADSPSRSSNNSASVGQWPPPGTREELTEVESKCQDHLVPGGRAGADEEKNRGRVGRGGGGEVGKDGGGGGGQRGTGGTPSTEAVLLGPRSRATSIGSTHPTGPVSRSSARPSQPREKSLVVSKNMDILDASQLLTGAAGVTGATTTVYTPGRPYGAEKGVGGLGYFQEFLGGFPPGLEDLGDFDFNCLEASPRAFSKDTSLQPVPTVQLEGDFGDVPEEATSKGKSDELPSRSRSTLTSRDLDWIDQLLLQKTISQAPRNVKRSATFFGALSGQVSRSPTKFFRKPTTSGHPLPRNTTPATPIPYTPLARTRTHTGGLGRETGGGKRGEGGDRSSRPSARGLGAFTGGKPQGPGRPETTRVPSSSAMPLSRRDPQHQDPASKTASRAPFFSSATSWRQRPPELPAHLFQDSLSKSAPTSSKVGGRKRVAFAEDGKKTNGGQPRPAPVKSSAVEASPTTSRPPQASAVGSSSPAASPRQAGHSELVAQNRGVPLLQEGSSSPANGHGDGRLGGKSPVRPVPEDSGNRNENLDSKSTKNVRPVPTLSYRTPSKQGVDSPPVPQQLSPRSGGPQSLLGNKRSSYLTSMAGSNRSRTKIVVSGARERNRKQFN